MTKREGCVLTAYTGVMLCNNFADFHGYAEKLLGRPIFTHEFANDKVVEELRKASEKEFTDIMERQT
jgi:hypothetical protein